MIRVWTDGCCLENPGGRGGWAFIAERDGEVLHRASGGHPETTNNRMEMQAVIEALRWLGNGRAEVVADSEYVVKGATDWMPRWKERGWRRPGRRGKGKPPLNLDLWQEMDRLLAGALVSLRWVKGHNGERFNEEADQLAGAAAYAVDVPTDPDPDPADEFAERFGWSPG